MEKQPDVHLNPAEVEAILRSGYLDSGSDEADVLEARKHVARRNRCQFLLELQADQESGFAKSMPRRTAVRTAGCPGEDNWPILAAGLTRGSEADMLLGHAAACNYCGALLRQLLQDFDEEVSPRRKSSWPVCKASGPNGRSAWAARAAEEASRHWILRWGRQVLRWFRRPLFPGIPVAAWAYALLLAMVVPPVVVEGVLGHRSAVIVSGPPVEDLLATAYTAQRTLELRVPQAAYGPLRLVRGSTAMSHLDRPAELLKSEARIAAQAG